MALDEQIQVEQLRRKREELLNDDLLGLEILCYLEEQNFPTGKPGTVIYKQLIWEIMLLMSDDFVDEDVLIQTIQNPYSVLYEDIAVYQCDIEILQMHKLIYEVCPNDEYKRGYIKKAYQLAKDLIESKKENIFVLNRKKSEEI